MSATSALMLAAAPFVIADLWPIIVVIVLGCAGIYLLLPRPRPYPTLWGSTLATLALIGAGILLVNNGAFSIESLLFYIFSGGAVVAGTLLVTLHNPARAALSFTLVILSTCGLFLLLAAPFLMAATIIIYAGAIVVTFLFVLMLAQQSGLSDADDRSREPLFSAIAGFAFLGALLFVLQSQYGTRPLDELIRLARLAESQQSAEQIVKIVGEKDELFTQFDRVLGRHGLPEFSGQVINEVRSKWPGDGSAEDMQQLLRKLAAIGEQARAQLSVQPFPPHADHPEKLSALSGPTPLTPTKELRRDPDTGVPLLPAENASYLGRSLFTDYLLPVELGGFLLLVAVVGAIAIAQRGGQEKPA